MIKVKFFQNLTNGNSIYLAVCFTHRRHLKHIEKKVFFTGKNIHQIPQTLRSVGCAIDVYVDVMESFP